MRIVLLATLALFLVPAALHSQRPLTSAEQDSLGDWASALAPELGATRIRPDQAEHGDRLVGATERVAGDVIAYRGTVEVHGMVEGSAVAFDGDVVLHPSAHVQGDAIAVGGRVRREGEGGRLDGEVRAVTGHRPGLEALFATRDEARGFAGVVSLVAAWFAVLAAIAFAVLLLARSNLVTIAERVREDFGRSLITGLIGQLALVPLLLLIVVGLAITIIGVLLIPFALVAYMVVVVGVATMGFLAMAYANGRAIRRRRDIVSGTDDTMGDITTHLMIGLGIYFALWAVAALAGPLGILGSLLRAMAVIITWLALTVGLGATILSRAGTRAPKTAAAPEPEEDDFSWQTPTPVSGVAAARRPTPAPRTPEWK